jgi:hypothetical protein
MLAPKLPLDIMDQAPLSPQQRLIRSLILLMCLGTLLLTCLRVIGQGYFPGDDALRHVAMVVSGQSWAEILVMRPEITMDSHPGWHSLLRGVQSITGGDKKLLLNFSVMFLFLAFALPPVLYFRRGEAWIASLALSSVFFFGPVFRLLYGRPFIASMVLILLFCFLWERIRDKEKPWAEIAVLGLVTALATWIHGTWYLFMLPLAALALARQWRVLSLTTGAMSVGVMLGAVLTGSPLAFLYQMLFHALEAFGQYDFQRQLVSEFQPFAGEALVFFLVGALLLWRRVRGEWDTRVVDNPVFYLMVIGWIMGFFAVRFWTDWGWPALAYWVAQEVQAVLEQYSDRFSLKRLILAAVFCLILLMAVTNDRGSRWPGVISEWPNIENAEQRPWLPDQDGILYNDDMILFYQIFYLNPHGPWRYTLGFEPIWMTADNLEIYRHIQLTRGKNESYAPWVKKMTEKDRMILVRNAKPQIEGLEWHEVTPSIWSGRLMPETHIKKRPAPVEQ